MPDTTDHQSPVVLTLALPIAKANDAQQIVSGWASVAVSKDGETLIDLDGDVIDIYDLEAAMHTYFKESGDLNFNHDGPSRGTLLEALTFTPEKIAALGVPAGVLPLGTFVSYHLPDPQDYALAKARGYLSFSIEGTALREEMP